MDPFTMFAMPGMAIRQSHLFHDPTKVYKIRGELLMCPSLYADFKQDWEEVLRRPITIVDMDNYFDQAKNDPFVRLHAEIECSIAKGHADIEAQYREIMRKRNLPPVTIGLQAGTACFGSLIPTM